VLDPGSPAECTGIKKRAVGGTPDPKHISTSYVERQNLTMRMGMRRFTGLTNAFSKKAENHVHALALYFVHYNWMRIHNNWMRIQKTLKVTPAMAAGLTTKLIGGRHNCDHGRSRSRSRSSAPSRHA
jgi:hypothetical protein